jgi:hypothetical protein
MRMPRQTASQSGHLIIYALVFMGIMMVAAASLVGYTTINVRSARTAQWQTQALYLAEAGIDKALYQLNEESSYTGETNTALGGGQYSVSITSIDAGTKLITATGYIPNSTNPVAKKVIKATATIDAANISFNFGVQVGEGGLDMDNNSTVNGNIYSNGSITGGNANITGDVTIAKGTSATADQTWEVQNNSFSFGNESSRRDVAQSFKAGQTNSLNKVQIYLRKVGNPGDLTIRILTNSGTNPSKTSLASVTVPASFITGTFGWAEATFSSPADLINNTTYWLQLSAPSVNSSNYYVWSSDSNNGYGNGIGKYSNNWNAGSPTWAVTGGDQNYRTFMGGVVTYFDGGIDIGGGLTATEIRRCGNVTGNALYESVFSSCSAGTSQATSTIPGPEAMPISPAQIDEWKQVAESGGIISGNFTVTGSQIRGPVKIDGDLTIANGATLFITGPIWVKGNITFVNGSTIQVDNSLGNFGTVILADNPANLAGSGFINVENNTILTGNGNPNSFLMVVTTNTDQTGAMLINNNAAGAIFYAANGAIDVSNNAGGNQITGYKIHLNENAVVNYTAGLQSSLFSNGPGGSWVFTPGTYIIE